MARQLRLEYEGAIYHITARGNERKKIYHSQRDYTKFKRISGDITLILRENPEQVLCPRKYQEPPTLKELGEVEFYTPSHINNRIIAQESVFAVFPLGRNDLEIVPLEKRQADHRIFLKITIPSTAKSSIKEELGILGINKMSIYPGIDGVVEKIKEECGLSGK
ncbi:hypothetical protein [uncultured Desulfuromusa sp.]|uniref:hypothetical protein n=1 Tax=uncultured Desulfuromusa sp. TaxID=219183 RepID=UPI002AA93A98|nr:hypothetical protein [uncultured Desulfuromusa sp.]